jgi:hypothetical protein
VCSLNWGTVLASFFGRLPPISYSGIERFIEFIIGILPVCFPPRYIIRFVYFKYLNNIFNIRDILGAATRGIIFRNLYIIFFFSGSFSTRNYLRITRIFYAFRMRFEYAPIISI